VGPFPRLFDPQIPRKTRLWNSKEWKKRSLLQRLVSWSCPYWKEEDLPAAFALVRLGYSIDRDWVLAHLSPGAMAGLLETPSLLSEKKIFDWVTKQAPLSPELLPLLKKDIREAEGERGKTPDGRPPSWEANILGVLALVKGEEAAGLLRKCLAAAYLKHRWFVLNFLRGRLHKGPAPPASSILAVLSLDWEAESLRRYGYSWISNLVREAVRKNVPGLEKVLPGLLENAALLKEQDRGIYMYPFFLPDCPPALKKKLAPFYLERMGRIRELLGKEFRKYCSNIFSFLAGSGLEGAKKYLLPFLRNPDPLVRQAASSALIRGWGKEVLDAVRPLAEDPEVSVRRSLAYPLARILPASKELMLVLLKDPDPQVSMKALSYLQPYLEPRDAPLLLKLCRSQDERLRKAARAALENLRFIQEQERFWKSWGVRKGLGASPLEVLFGQASPGNPRKTRLLALRSLGALGDPKALPFLIEQTKDKDPRIAAQAELSLQFLLEKSGVPVPKKK